MDEQLNPFTASPPKTRFHDASAIPLADNGMDDDGDDVESHCRVQPRRYQHRFGQLSFMH
jgi:hypothetical protein